MKRKSLGLYCIIFILFPAINLLSGCRHYQYAVSLDIDREFQKDREASILLETKDGCSKNRFRMKKAYDELETKPEYFTASDMDELKNQIEPYFESELFREIDPEFFRQNSIVLFVAGIHDSDMTRNGRFEQNDGTYRFVFEVWDRGNPFLYSRKCVYTKIFILQIPKGKSY